MLLSLSSVFWLCLVIGSLRALVSYVRRERIRRSMPPGPPPLPFLGNLLQLTKFPWLRFTEWKEQYGPIFSLNLAGQPVIVLNDFTVTADLTDRRSGIYSDRPRLIMAGELMSKHMVLPLTPYGNLWRDMRKAAHEGFNIHVAKSYRPLQEQAAHKLLTTLLYNPRQRGWDQDIESSLAQTMLSITYALTLEEVEQRKDIVHYVADFTQRFATAALPGNSMIDIFRFLEHIPHAVNPWKIHGEKSYQKDTRVLVGLLDEVRRKVAAGTAPKSFCSDLIELEQRGELTEAQAAWLCGLVYVAGVETTASVMQVFVLAMVLNPEVMRRAQMEIDTIVGRDRLPNFDDVDDLPYVNALICEVLRWCPVAPLGVAKRCTQDDFYCGYFIPEGALILQNVWAINHDPNHFDEPEVFKPERYLGDDGKMKDPISDTHGHGHGTFGSGRRICVGRDLAQQALFIYVATVLWATNITPSSDEQGQAVIPSWVALEDKGIVVRPAAFPCVIKPRDQHVEHVLSALAGEY